MSRIRLPTAPLVDYCESDMTYIRMPLGTVTVQPLSVQVAVTQVATSSRGAEESVIVSDVLVMVITGFTPEASPLPLCIISKPRSDEPPARVCAVALRHNAMSAVRKNTFFITSYFLVYAKIRLTALICKSFQPNG